MTRIIAGTHGGRQIRTPKGETTRPTSDRVREALFSSLESVLGGFTGVRVLDLFAGSGALGLESLSRGAESAVFVDSDARAVAAVKANVRDLGLTHAQVVRGTARSYVEHAPVGAFDLVFIDPPYAVPTEQVRDLVEALTESVTVDALFVVERSSRDRFDWPPTDEGLRERRYGETTLWLGRPLVESPT